MSLVTALSNGLQRRYQKQVALFRSATTTTRPPPPPPPPPGWTCTTPLRSRALIGQRRDASTSASFSCSSRQREGGSVPTNPSWCRTAFHFSARRALVGWVVEVRRQQHRPFTVSSSAPTTIGFAGGHFLALPRYDDRGAHRHFRDGKWSLVITSSVPAHTSGRRCLFHSEAEYHQVADSTLQDIQDAIDEAFDKISNSGSAPDSSSSLVSPAAAEYELTLASGVLTLGLPGHGTWVLNKQTPNRQIWWSSPLSGPKRFEYLEGSWCSTKDGLALGPLLVQELRHVHPWLEIELRL